MLNILYNQNGIFVAQSRADFSDKLANAPYGGFNLGLHTGDEPTGVLHNRSRLLSLVRQATANQVQSLHWLSQIHSDLVAQPNPPSLVPNGADAWVGDDVGKGLVIMTADCVPIVLVGERAKNGGNGSVACIHAGWQGLVGGVIGATLDALPKDSYQAFVGGCIGGANYEIDKTLGERIVSDCLPMVGVSKDVLANTILLSSDKADKCHLDVVALTTLQLAHRQVLPMSDKVECSYDGARVGEQYSHRFATHQQWQNTGRMAMIVAKY